MTDRKKPGVAFWAIVVVLVVLVGYPLSFGPACWWFSARQPPGINLVSTAYWPIGWIYWRASDGGYVQRAINWYALRRDYQIALPIDTEPTYMVVRRF